MLTRPAKTGDIAVVLAALALSASGCIVVYDFEYEDGGRGGGGATQGGGGQGSGGAPQGGGGATQGGGGAGGGSCFPGDGPDDVAPWSVALPGFTQQASGPPRVRFDGERAFFALPLESEGAPVMFLGQTLVPSGGRGLAVGWIDDSGTEGTAMLLDLQPSSADLALLGDGKLVVAASEGARSHLIEVDLCAMTATDLATCESGSLLSSRVDADPDNGRTAWAFEIASGADLTCTFVDRPQCPLPAGPFVHDSVLLVSDPEDCWTLLARATAPPGEPSYQNLLLPRVARGRDEVWFAGQYDGEMFGAETGEACLLEPCIADMCTTATGDCFTSLHRVVGRAVHAGGVASFSAIRDLGRLGSFGHELEALGEDALLAVHLRDTLPEGAEFADLPSPTFDLLIARLPHEGGVAWKRLLDAGGDAVVATFTRAPTGTFLGLRTYPVDSDVELGSCLDAAGCAAFVQVDEADGSLGAPLVIDEVGSDGAVGAAALSSGGDLLVARTRPSGASLALVIERTPAP